MQNQIRPVANTMQTTACECQSFTSGISYGAGLAVGIGVVTAVTAGILKLWKQR